MIAANRQWSFSCLGGGGSRHALPEIGLNDVDQFLDTLRFGGTTFDSRIDQVHADVVLDDLRNKAVYRTARRDYDMQHLRASLLVSECPVGRFYLATDASNSVQKLGLLSDGCGISLMSDLSKWIRSHCAGGTSSNWRSAGLTRGVAACAVSVDEDYMVDHAESRRNQLSQMVKAALEFEQSPAFQTMKMMVMPFTANLVSWRLSRNFNRDEPPFIGQAFYGSIHRGHSESGEVFLCQPEHFVRSKGTIVAFKDLADLPTLLRVTTKRFV
jgi:hypothetical protein